MLSPLPRRSGWVHGLLASPTVSAFPDMAVGSARALSFSRLIRRSLELRPAHSRCHRISWHASPKASTVSLPPQLLRLLPAGAVAGWDSHPLGKRRLSTAHARSGPIVHRICVPEPVVSRPPNSPWLTARRSIRDCGFPSERPCQAMRLMRARPKSLAAQMSIAHAAPTGASL
jgi:hypothetical protein